jgi:hypothetical protein
MLYEYEISEIWMARGTIICGKALDMVPRFFAVSYQRLLNLPGPTVRPGNSMSKNQIPSFRESRGPGLNSLSPLMGIPQYPACILVHSTQVSQRDMYAFFWLASSVATMLMR